MSMFLFLNRALMLGTNGSFAIVAVAHGGVGGFSLKKNITDNAETVPIIAYVTRD